MLVSVVVPAHNAERFVVEAAQSVLGQTLTDLELIIVDDGSTDATLTRIRSVRDPRLKVLTGPRGGAARARNRGAAAAAASRYLAFLDADDLWDPTKLQVQVEYLEAHPEVQTLGCFMRYISSAGRRLGETGTRVGPQEQAEVAAARLFPFPTPTLILRRSAWHAVGGFDEGMAEGSEDIELYCRLARHGRMECLPMVLGSVRIHPDSMMARERLKVNRAARFVQQRLARRDQGGDLTWNEFLATHRRTLSQRWQDRLEVCYRSAALWYGERRLGKALAYGGLAFLIGPRYTLRRVYRQRLGGDSGQ